jgi:hypothetical protein
VIVAITIYGSGVLLHRAIQASSGLVQLALVSAARIGLFTSLASLGVPLGTFVYTRIAGQGPLRLLCAEFALIAAGFAIMGHSTSVPMFLAGCFVNQVGGACCCPRCWSGRSACCPMRCGREARACGNRPLRWANGSARWW